MNEDNHVVIMKLLKWQQTTWMIKNSSMSKVCFHTMWSGWCEELVERINVETKQDLSQVLIMALLVIMI